MGFLDKLFGKKENQTTTPVAAERKESTTQPQPASSADTPLYGGATLLAAPRTGGEFIIDLKPHSLNGMFIVKLPVEWEPFESDRFRAKSADETTLLSITLYQGDIPAKPIDAAFFKEMQLGMYERCVVEGEYEPYDDLLATDAFITQSFKVDDETQYYLTTSRLMGDHVIFVNIIIRNLADYDLRMRAVIQTIASSITPLGQ